MSPYLQESALHGAVTARVNTQDMAMLLTMLFPDYRLKSIKVTLTNRQPRKVQQMRRSLPMNSLAGFGCVGSNLFCLENDKISGTLGDIHAAISHGAVVISGHSKFLRNLAMVAVMRLQFAERLLDIFLIHLTPHANKMRENLAVVKHNFYHIENFAAGRVN